MGIRCFIAVKLSEDLKREVGLSIEDLKRSGADVKWVKPENLHITLKFLGETDEDLIPEMGEKLAAVAKKFRPFSLSLTGTGVFPGSRRPRVVWIDILGAEDLIKLQAEVEESLTTFGFEREDRPFSPHLTIGRLRSQKNVVSLLRAMEPLAEKYFGNIDVSSISLIKSVLKPGGPDYSTLAELHLKEER